VASAARGAQIERTNGEFLLLHFQSRTTNPQKQKQGGKKIMKQKFFALLAVAIMLLTLAVGCGGSSGSSSSGTTSGNVSGSAE
jgi:hypothetical protein